MDSKNNDTNKRTKCMASNCDRYSIARGLCNKHYIYARYHNLTNVDVIDYEELNRLISLPKERFCNVENCNSNYYAKGMCLAHYRISTKDNLKSRSNIKNKGKKCCIEGCNNGSHSMRLCRTHYKNYSYRKLSLTEYIEKINSGELKLGGKRY